MQEYTLEAIEWTQYWAEECTKDKTSVLMIGDSISVGYRSEVNRLLSDSMSIAAYSTSKAIDNPWFEEELSIVVRQHNFNYDTVTLNNGLHGFHLTTEAYEAGMRALIKTVQNLLPFSKLYLVLSTPITENGNPDILSDKNHIVIERNAAVTRIAAELHLPVIDLYNAVLGKAVLSNGDGYHYNEEGYQVLAAEIARAVDRKRFG